MSARVYWWMQEMVLSSVLSGGSGRDSYGGGCDPVVQRL